MNLYQDNIPTGELVGEEEYKDKDLDTPAILRNKQEKTEEDYSEEYPNGGMAEPYDIEGDR